MAVLKIFNDIQSENEKKACQFWGDAEGVCFKDVDEFVAGMDADDNVIDVLVFIHQCLHLFTVTLAPLHIQIEDFVLLRLQIICCLPQLIRRHRIIK